MTFSGNKTSYNYIFGGNLDVYGRLNVGNDAFFAKNVTIGVDSKLDVEGRAFFNENVGIGTDNPNATLHVQNNANVPGGNIQRWTADTGTNVRNAQFIAPEIDDPSEPFTFSTGNAWNFRVDTDDALTIDSSGDVGINKTAPSTRLTIDHTTPIDTTNAAIAGELGNVYLEMSSGGTEGDGNLGPSLNFTGINQSGVNGRKAAIIAQQTGANSSQVGLSFWTNNTTDSGGVIQNRMVINANGDVTISNDLAVNTDTLYVDTVNDRVGIGTASPSEALDIQGGLLINGANVTAVLSGSIADDSFYSLDLTAAGFILGGLATITSYSTYDTFSQPVGTGIFYYDCGSSVTGARILADADASTPINGGTTSTSTTITDFTDGRITIICNSNTLRIANRIGGARRFKLTFL